MDGRVTQAVSSVLSFPDFGFCRHLDRCHDPVVRGEVRWGGGVLQCDGMGMGVGSGWGGGGISAALVLDGGGSGVFQYLFV